MSHAWNRDAIRGRRDFAGLRAVDPHNPLLLHGEALLSMDAEDYATAVAKLTAALEKDPRDVWSLRMRSQAYTHLGEDQKSRADQDRVREIERAAAAAS